MTQNPYELTLVTEVVQVEKPVIANDIGGQLPLDESLQLFRDIKHTSREARRAMSFSRRRIHEEQLREIREMEIRFGIEF